MANTNSDTASSTAPDVAQEVSAIVARARAAQEAIADWDQERVDELVTAVGWAIVRKDHAESLAQLAVDEGGFGTYADKLTKIQRRVNGLLAGYAFPTTRHPFPGRFQFSHGSLASERFPLEQRHGIQRGGT